MQSGTGHQIADEIEKELSIKLTEEDRKEVEKLYYLAAEHPEMNDFKGSLSALVYAIHNQFWGDARMHSIAVIVAFKTLEKSNKALRKQVNDYVLEFTRQHFLAKRPTLRY